MSNKKKVYFHKKQLEAMVIGANKEFIVAPRGWGKSEGVDGPRLLRNTIEMPRSAGALLSPTYGKLLRNTLPAVFRSLERLGYHRNRHYFVGRRAPKALGFKTPLIDPFDGEVIRKTEETIRITYSETVIIESFKRNFRKSMSSSLRILKS